MKRIIACLLTAAMLLLPAACSGGMPAPTTTAPNETSQTTPTQPAETTAPPETEPVQTEPAMQRVKPLNILVGERCLYDMTDDDIRLATVSWQPIVLGDDSAVEYPALAEALDAWNWDEMEHSHESLESMVADAKIMVKEMGAEFYGFTDTNVSHVQRADDRILSVRFEYDIYNGMRPFGGNLCLNLKPDTGEKLYIDDILTDVSGLPQLIVDAMRVKYTDLREEEFESMEGYLEAYSPEAYTWTLSYQGVTFYFGVAELAAGAVGELDVTLWFDEYPELFVSEYTGIPAGGYALELRQGDINNVDLHPGDGQRDRLFVFSLDENELILGINGNNIYDTDYYGYYFDAYLVTPDNAQFYLYVESAGDNDYRTIHIYDLSGETPEKVTGLSGVGFGCRWGEDMQNDVCYAEVFNDPSDFTMGTRIDLLGTMTGKRSYHVSPVSGIPVPETEYHTLSNYQRTLESKTSLEVLILPDETVETLPAGTVFRFLRTNGCTYADFELEDRRECRIPVAKEGYQCFVNGIAEEDCFEGICYAG